MRGDVEISPYDPAQHSDEVYALWQGVMQEVFPLTRASARKAFDINPAYALIAKRDQAIVGFISGQKAALQALVVGQEVQRQGIGTALHDALLERLRQDGVKVVQLGGGNPRLFPGVPDTAAAEFFKSRGWSYSETSVDMIQALEDYFTPAGMLENIAQQGIRLELCQAGIVPEVLAFVKSEFPSWLAAYQSIVEVGDLKDILLALDAESRIVACLILYGNGSHPSRLDTPWQGIWGNTLGALGAVGTAESQRRRGIGSAMVAYGTQLLKERGASHSFIGWTWAETFYGSLGYSVWQRYHMSWRQLDKYTP